MIKQEWKLVQTILRALFTIWVCLSISGCVFVPVTNTNTFYNDIIPAANSTYDLGSNTRWWNRLYVDYLVAGTLVSSGNLTAHAPQHYAGGIDPVDHNQLANLAVGDVHTQYVRADGTRAFTGAQSMGGHALTNVLDPILNQDAATKLYVDTEVAGLGTGNITGVGTAGTIPEWTGVATLGNSPITHLGGLLNVNTHAITNVVDPTNAQDAATKNYVTTAIAAIPASTGNVTATSMTTGRIPVSTSTTGLTNSIVTANATYINVAGGITVTGTVDGYDVSALGLASHTQGTDTALGAVAAKNPPIDADKALYRDSTAGDALVTSTWTQVKAFLKTYFDTLYSALGGTGNVTASGMTTGYVPVSTSTTGLTNSIITANSTTVVVTGNIAVTGTVDGVDVSVIGAASHTQNTDTALGAVGTKNPPVDADKALYRNSAAGDALVTSTWTQVKAFLKTYFDTLYGTGTGNVTYTISTADYVPKWSPAGNLINSTISSNATYVTVSGGIVPTGNIVMAAVATVDGYDVSTLGAASHTQGTDTTLGTMTANITMGNHYITGITNPSIAQDAATKDYVDTAIAGIPTGTGNVTATSMTTGYIPVSTSTTGLTNSIATANATYVSVAGSIAVTGTVDGVDIAAIGAASHTQGTDTALGAVATKNPPIDADKALYRDSTAGDALVTSTWTQVKAFLKTYFDGIYAAIGGATGNVTYTQATADYLPKYNGVAGNLVNSTISSNTTSVYVANNLAATGNITATNIPLTNNVAAIEFVIDGGGVAITTGIKGDLEVPFDCTIDRATALADQSGNVTVAIWKSTYAAFPPTVTSNITASAPITITSASKSQDSTLTGWTKAITAGDILRYSVDSCAVITRVTVSLRVVKQ